MAYGDDSYRGGGENGRPNQCQILQILLHQYLYLCSRLTVLKSVQCLNVPAFPFSTSSIFSSQVADYEKFLRQFWSASENSPMAPSRDAPTPYIPSLNLRTIPMGFVHFLDLFQSLPSRRRIVIISVLSQKGSNSKVRTLIHDPLARDRFCTAIVFVFSSLPPVCRPNLSPPMVSAVCDMNTPRLFRS